MFQKTLFSLVFIISVFFSYSQDYNYDNYSKIKELFSPRDEGAENERRLVKYIESFCKYNKLEYKTEKINNKNDIVANSYNIEVYLKGYSSEREKFIIVCPLNTAIIYQNDIDNSISIKITLDLIRLCKQIPFKKDIIFLFTGANEREESYYLGIKYFLERNDDLGKSFVTVINILSNKNDIRFFGSINAKPIPLEILKKYLKLTNATRLNFYFKREEIYKSRFYLLPKNNYNSVFLNNDIQAVTFSNKDNSTRDKFVFDEEYQKKLADFFFAWILSFDKVKFPIDADYHYQYFNIFGLKLIISEVFQIILFLILILIVIFTRFFFPRFQRLHYFLLIKGIPYFLIIFILYLLISFIPMLLFIPINLFTGVSKTFLEYPLLYFLNVFLISLSIILLFFELIKKLPFPKHSYLYVYGALVFTGLNLIIFAFIDISISFVYLLAFIAITISQYTGRKFNLKFLLYLLSAVPLLLLSIDIAYFGNMENLKHINPIILNIIFSIFTFPFLLLTLRIDLFLRIKYKKLIKRSPLIIFLIIFMSLSLSLLISLSVLYKQKSTFITAKLITGVKNNSSHLLIESDKNIGEIYIDDGKQLSKYVFKNSKMFIPVVSILPPYKIEYQKFKSAYFNFVLNIASELPIEYLDIYFIVPKDLYPLESNYNFKKVDNYGSEYKNEGEDVYKFITPRNVGANFFFKMAVLEHPFKMIVEIEYPYINFGGILIKVPDGIINKRSIFIETIDIK